MSQPTAQAPTVLPPLAYGSADRGSPVPLRCDAQNLRRKPTDMEIHGGLISEQRGGLFWLGQVAAASCMRTLDMAPGEPGSVSLPIDMTGALVADTALEPVPAEWNADQALTAIYSEHYRSLVRLAAFLVRDTATAEEVVQDSFVAMHQGWCRLRDSDKALSYLRQSVVNRSRSVLRHQTVVSRNTPESLPYMPSAEHGAILQLERSAVLAALRKLPARQREALVLRYYGDLPEGQIAAVMGISRGSVKSHTARAIAALRAVLEWQT